MKPEIITKTETIKTEQKIMRYSQSDIDELIVADINKNGYKVETIQYETGYKYNSDSWGMNNHLTTIFKGVTVTLKGEDK